MGHYDYFYEKEREEQAKLEDECPSCGYRKLKTENICDYCVTRIKKLKLDQRILKYAKEHGLLD